MQADEHRRMWVPGSPAMQLEIVKQRLVKAGRLGPRAGPASWRKDALITTEPRPKRRQQEKANVLSRSTSPRREESWCWDSQIARVKTPGALSRTEPSPYSNIPNILMSQHPHRLKRLIEHQVAPIPSTRLRLARRCKAHAVRPPSFVHGGPA